MDALDGGLHIVLALLFSVFVVTNTHTTSKMAFIRAPFVCVVVIHYVGNRFDIFASTNI